MMKKWRRNFWPSELRLLIKDILSSGDMTVRELADVVERSMEINIHHAAMAAILASTEGVYVKCQRFSDVGKKMVNIYSTGVQNRKDKIL
jgi:hypothetical protein